MDKFVRDNEVVYRAICINGLDKSKAFFDASNIFLTNSIDGCSVDRDDNGHGHLHVFATAIPAVQKTGHRSQIYGEQ